MRADEYARHARVIEETFDDGAQALLVHVLAEKYPDAQALGERPRRYRGVMLPPTVDEDSPETAALVKVSLTRGLAVNQRQVVGESRDGAHRHAVRDEDDGDAALARREVEGDAVGVAVARHHGEAEATAAEDFEVARVVGDQFGDAEHLEELVAPVQQARETEHASPVPARAPGQREKCRGVGAAAELQFSPTKLREQPGQSLDGPPLVAETCDPDRAAAPSAPTHFEKPRQPAEQSDHRGRFGLPLPFDPLRAGAQTVVL